MAYVPPNINSQQKPQQPQQTVFSQQQPIYQQTYPQYQIQPAYAQQPLLQPQGERPYVQMQNDQGPHTQQPYVQQTYPQPQYIQPPTQTNIYVQQTVTINQGQEFLNFKSCTVEGEAGEYGCGTSEYGLRMDFKNRRFRDIPFLVLWVASMISWFILLIVFAAADDSTSDSSSNSDYNDNDYRRRRLGHMASDIGKVVGLVIILLFLGISSGYFWLELLFKYSKHILQYIVYFKLSVWFLLSIICFIVSIKIPEFLGFGIILLIVFLFWLFYYWCVWQRLKLAAAMTRLGTSVVRQNKATVCLQFLTCVGLFAWFILWISVVVLYALKFESSGGLLLLMIVMWYWTAEILRKIAFVTTCGVTAVWWFNKDKMTNPTWNSYRYATTKGLGSICCGSMLVGIIQTLRSMAKAGTQRGGLAAASCYIFLEFTNWLIRYFNIYAYVQVAVYGVGYLQAAQNTWQLLSSRLFDSIINDDLTNTLLAAASFISACFTFIIGGFIGYAMFVGDDDTDIVFFVILVGILGFFIGYYFTLHFMSAVFSAVKAIFVLWAEDPQALHETHPKCYNVMAKAWAKIYGHASSHNPLENIDDELD